MKNNIIVGAGRLGSNVANSLSLNGENVILIDIDKTNFQFLPVTYSGLTYQGDATNIDVLKANGIDNCKRLMVFTNNDNINIFIASFVNKYFDVPSIIIRLSNERNEVLLKGTNIKVLNPFKLSVEQLDKILKENKKL